MEAIVRDFDWYDMQVHLIDFRLSLVGLIVAYNIHFDILIWSIRGFSIRLIDKASIDHQLMWTPNKKRHIDPSLCEDRLCYTEAKN
jgi:hypothetical protein